MRTVSQLYKPLEHAPACPVPPGIEVRHFAGPSDIARWIELRRRAFATETLGVRTWSPGDFASEFFDKPWWDPRHMWLAERREAGSPLLVGTVTLALRGVGTAAKPVVHWLFVHPKFRRQGIGRLLLKTLERQAWGRGHRQVFLETHARWESAQRCYEALGYRPV